MKQNQTQKTISRTKYFTLAFFTLFTISSIFSCQKINQNENEFKDSKKLEPEVAAVKEWFYGIFNKSTDFKFTANKLDQNGKLKNSNDLSNHKWVYWNKAKYVKLGTKTFIEAPILYSDAKLTFFNSTTKSSLEDDVEKKNVQHRIIYTKYSKNYGINIITIQPSYQFTKDNNFDISNLSFFNLSKAKFSGHIFSKNWKEEIDKIYEYKEGKIIKSIKINTKDTKSNNARSTWECHNIVVKNCILTSMTCVVIPTGDEPPVPCGPSNPTVVYNYECTDKEVEICVEIPDEIDPSACENTPNPDQCMCDLYSIGCTEPTCAQMGLSDELCCAAYGQNCPSSVDDECAAEVAAFTSPGNATQNGVSSVDYSNLSSTGFENRHFKWFIFTQGLWSIESTELGTIEKKTYFNANFPNNEYKRWEFQSMSHLGDLAVGVNNFGGTRSFHVTTPVYNITGTKQVVWEDVSFSITSSPICKGIALPDVTLVYSAHCRHFAPHL